LPLGCLQGGTATLIAIDTAAGRERIVLEVKTSDSKLEAYRDGSKKKRIAPPERIDIVGQHLGRDAPIGGRICIGLMTSDRKLEASREGST